jgi:hypothetical protein
MNSFEIPEDKKEYTIPTVYIFLLVLCILMTIEIFFGLELL